MYRKILISFMAFMIAVIPIRIAFAGAPALPPVTPQQFVTKAGTKVIGAIVARQQFRIVSSQAVKETAQAIGSRLSPSELQLIEDYAIAAKNSGGTGWTRMLVDPGLVATIGGLTLAIMQNAGLTEYNELQEMGTEGTIYNTGKTPAWSGFSFTRAVDNTSAHLNKPSQLGGGQDRYTTSWNTATYVAQVRYKVRSDGVNLDWYPDLMNPAWSSMVLKGAHLATVEQFNTWLTAYGLGGGIATKSADLQGKISEDAPFTNPYNQPIPTNVPTGNGMTDEQYYEALRDPSSAIPTLSPPAEIGRFEASAGAGVVNLMWDGVQGATSYFLFRDGVKIYEGSNLTFSDNTVTPTTSYDYELVALNADGSTVKSMGIMTPEVGVVPEPLPEPIPVTNPAPVPEPIPEIPTAPSPVELPEPMPATDPLVEVSWLEAIWNWLKNFPVMLQALFIPTLQLSPYITPIADTIRQKFPIVPQLYSALYPLFSGNDCDVSDLYVDSPLFGRIQVLETDEILKHSVTWKEWMRGFIWFVVAFMVMRKINALIQGAPAAPK